MCGIAGIYNTTNNFNQEAALKEMSALLSHRGPDAEGFFTDPPIFLAHRRLSIIDLRNQANQPMHSSCGRYVIIFNGEIYNFKEIAAEIQKIDNSLKFKTQSDTEVLIEAFRVWGAGFVEKLNGMFALAIWDKKEQKLHLYRDRIGIKPLFIYHHNGTLAFASELKALIRMPFIKQNLSINKASVNHFLNLGYIPAPMSIFNETQKFPQACHGVFDGKDIVLKRYWHPAQTTDRTNLLKNEQQALEELETVLRSSVEYRMYADVPFGTFLSGGIDSSTVTALAQSMSGDPVKTFSIGSWNDQLNEAPFAAKIAKHLGTNHHEYYVTAKDALDLIPAITQIYDEPWADSSAVPTLLVSKMAREKVTMTLSGDGGDELFMGYGAYQWAERLNNPILKPFFKPVSAILRNGPVKYRRTSRMFEKVDKRKQSAHIFSQEQYFFSEKEIQQLLSNEYLQETDTLPLTNPDFNSPAENQSWFDLHYYLPDDLLTKVDRASMYHGLETRVPLLDHRIVEWAFRVDPSLKVRGKTTKYLLKKLLYKYVPPQFFDRPKKGFAIPLKDWMKTDLKSFVTDYLGENSIKRNGVFNPDSINILLTDFHKKDQHYLYNRIWLTVIMEKWMSENI